VNSVNHGGKVLEYQRAAVSLGETLMKDLEVMPLPASNINEQYLSMLGVVAIEHSFLDIVPVTPIVLFAQRSAHEEGKVCKQRRLRGQEIEQVEFGVVGVLEEAISRLTRILPVRFFEELRATHCGPHKNITSDKSVSTLSTSYLEIHIPIAGCDRR
jgi:hypothetical protein